MSLKALAYKVPLSDDIWTQHPALAFLQKYQQDFQQNSGTLDPERYYNEDCTMVLSDNSTITGAPQMWRFFGELYGAFPKLSRDLRTIVVIEDDNVHETYDLHLHVATELYYDLQRSPVVVLQSFAYTIGKATHGMGTDGLQFFRLTCCYDMSLIEKAHELLAESGD